MGGVTTGAFGTGAAGGAGGGGGWAFGLQPITTAAKRNHFTAWQRREFMSRGEKSLALLRRCLLVFGFQLVHLGIRDASPDDDEMVIVRWLLHALELQRAAIDVNPD